MGSINLDLEIVSGLIPGLQLEVSQTVTGRIIIQTLIARLPACRRDLWQCSLCAPRLIGSINAEDITYYSCLEMLQT